jgi:peptidoglycan/xylan/chitin deacetylase (PgdA/CDA1 family)
MDQLVAEFGAIDRPKGALLPLTWPMLARMQRCGITIGSHTRTHARLSREPIDTLAEEVEGSRQELEHVLGRSVKHLAYPDGSFDRACVRAVAAAGYEFAYTTCLHRDPQHPLLTIPRRLLWEHSSVDAAGRFAPDILDCQMRGFLTGPRPCTWHSHA